VEDFSMAVITGTNGNDDLTGGPDGDTILALDGDDILRSGSNLPGEFHGGKGNDTYYISRGDTVVEDAGEGIDTVYYNSSIREYVLPANVENLVIQTSSVRAWGNALDNNITGSIGNDQISAGAGNNHIDGAGGLDTIIYDMGAGSVNVNLATGVVSSNGFGGVDTLANIENVTGSTAADVIVGDANANVLSGGGGIDHLEGGDGNDFLVANGAMYGGAGTDSLRGGGGNDYLDGGAGDDTMYGQTGNDTYVVDSANDVVIESPGDGTADTVILNLAGVYDISKDPDHSDIENITANFDGTTVIANDKNNVLTGAAGSQTFRGLGGNNTIDGGAGVDTADYSTGTLTLSIDLNQGSASHNGFGGVDTVSNIENVTGTNFNDTIVGNASDNRLDGGSGADVLAGLDGNDVLIGSFGGVNNTYNEMLGGKGDDTYYQSAAGDTLYEAANEGVDTVHTTLAVLTLRDNFENLIYDGSSAFSGGGNALANVIHGGTAADELSGFGGDDTLYGGTGAANTLMGGQGNDVYYVDASGDSVLEQAGEGADLVFTALSQYIMPDNVETLVYTGSGAFLGIGSNTNNSIVGGVGADDLSGLGGDDFLVGNSGADQLQGGSGSDAFGYLGGETGLDRILDFQSGTDKILLSSAFYHPTGTVDFVSGAGASAQTSNSTFLYDPSTGIVSFDADGNGAGAAVQLAQLNAGQIVAASDFGFF
jgi:Ca2+-binding RTX toxin-like protein